MATKTDCTKNILSSITIVVQTASKQTTSNKNKNKNKTRLRVLKPTTFVIIVIKVYALLCCLSLYNVFV